MNEAYRIEHLRGGHPSKLSVLDRLVIMLSCYRDYRTMENIAFEYGVAKSTICEKEKTYDKGSDSGRRKGFKDTQRLVFTRERS
ncbi:hypothetical protein AB8B23_05245 [Leptotrichia sp. HSP-342]|uniref:Transposase Helix-turn-helix domain-containing protein n=1 Tax=Leptotrichia mesophila TaxID=3239303 RepID=A0AB39VEC1_9FUSO